MNMIPSEGQLFRAEWVDADHIFLTPVNAPESITPTVLAVRWNGDNANEFQPFGDKVKGPYGDGMLLLAYLHDGSHTWVKQGEWMIRDSQGNINPQSKHFEGLDSIKLRDGITYELKKVEISYQDGTKNKKIYLTPTTE